MFSQHYWKHIKQQGMSLQKQRSETEHATNVIYTVSLHKLTSKLKINTGGKNKHRTDFLKICSQ